MLNAFPIPWFLVVLLPISYFIASAIYNLYFSPLAKFPGPFWAKISAWPNFYYSTTGRRHIWIWQCHQIYGDVIRYKPNGVLFNSPSAYATIYGTRANVKRGKSYEIAQRNSQNINTFTTVDKLAHARKRRVLNSAFSEKAIRSAEPFIIKHVDRWCELLIQDNDSKQWTESHDMSELADFLSFDIMGDLTFGKSFEMKEKGDNPFKAMPHIMTGYVEFMYPITQSPILSLWVWLKPRGLDAFIERNLPPNIKKYYDFVDQSVLKRLREEEELEKKGSDSDQVLARKDMFHYLFKVRDEDGKPSYSTDELYAEANLLIIGGTDTVSGTLCCFWFYIIRHPRCYNKLVHEILTTFASVDEIQSSIALAPCEYLQACVNEALRLSPAGSSGLSREVLAGGFDVDGQHIPEGIEIGVAGWSIMHHEASYGDPWVFRPERWIIDPITGVTAEDVARAQAAFNPFSIGSGNCVGQKLAASELFITIARMLYKMDVRLLPGDSLGGGSPELGWGMRSPDQFQIRDALASHKVGPRVQFKRRAA